MGLIRMAARTAVISGTATAVSGRVARRQADKYVEEDAARRAQLDAAQQAATPAPAPAAAAPAVGGDEQTAQLTNLASLHAQGILSDEEFSAAKAKVLGI